MILVTVGMQLGFDRLIEAMDALAPDLDMPVIAQTGKGTYAPKNMEARVKIAPDEFESLVQQSRLIVSHAGIGTVLTAARFSKPILLFARRADLGEHRNDHQLATVRHLKNRPGILTAETAQELPKRIAEGLEQHEVAHRTASAQAQQLNQAVAQFIESGSLSR
ncbi:MAG: glycosyltransferase [Pseudomonadota bacterium]